MAAVPSTADHVSRERAEPRTHGDSAQVPADKAACDATTNSADEGASTGGGSVAAGGE